MKDIDSGIALNRLKILNGKLTLLWTNKDYKGLLQLILATDLEKYELKFFDVICVLVRATSKRLQTVEQDWTLFENV